MSLGDGRECRLDIKRFRHISHSQKITSKPGLWYFCVFVKCVRGIGVYVMRLCVSLSVHPSVCISNASPIIPVASALMLNCYQ